MEQQRTTFASEGLRLVGDLRIPSAEPGARLPAIVFTGPFTGVKEQVTGNYARRLAERGYVTLAFDHRNFGASEGAPRQHEDPDGKLADLRDAVSYLATLPAVNRDRIGVCGVCLGTAYALKFSAFDPRVRALALIAGAYNDPREMRRGFGSEQYRQQLLRFAEVAQRQYVTGEVEYIPAVSPDDSPAAMPGREPWAYYGTERSASPGWQNRVTVLSIRALITLDAASAADFISPTPVLFVHGRRDDYCSPEGAAATYERAGQPKEILWIEAQQHIDLYDVEEFVAPAATRAGEWFDRYL